MDMNRRQFLRDMTLSVPTWVGLVPRRLGADDREQSLFARAPFVNASDLTTVGLLPGYASGPNFDTGYIEKLQRGRVTIVSASLVFWLYDEFSDTAARVHDFERLFETYPNALQRVRTYADIDAAGEEDRIAVLMHAHTPSIIGGDLRNLEAVHDMGLRVLGFSHQQSSLLAEGAGEDLADGDGGLTRFGAAVLREANRLHVLADLGHASDQSIMQAADASSAPIVVSHTCVRSLAPHDARSLFYRNIADDSIRAVAANGGVIGIMALTPHLLVSGSGRRPSVDVFVDHVQYVAELVGFDHVGVGTETGHGSTAADMKRLMSGIVQRLGSNTPVIETFNAVASLPPGTGLVVPGMDDMSQIKLNLIRAMVRRGWSDDEIEKVLGLNFERVYRDVFAA